MPLAERHRMEETLEETALNITGLFFRQQFCKMHTSVHLIEYWCGVRHHNFLNYLSADVITQDKADEEKELTENENDEDG